MSWERSPPVVDLELGASRTLAVLTTLAYAAAAAALAISGLPPAAKVAGWAVLGASWGWSIAVHCLRLAPFSVRRVVLDPEGGCVLADRHGRTHDGELLPGVWVGTRLVALRVRLRERRPARALALAADAVPAAGFRRLRMRLRVSPPAAKGGTAARLWRHAQRAVSSGLRRLRPVASEDRDSPKNPPKS